ncbi:MAG: oxidoreductase [Bacillota bacterium]
MPSLFDPFLLSGLRLRNRVVMAPMVSDYATEAGEVTLRLISYYGERADGGVGLITVEATAVAQSGRLGQNQLGIWADDQLQGLRYLVERIHATGAKVAIQLHHAGRQSSFGARIHADLVAPSPIPSPTLPLSKPRELAPAEVRAIVLDFARAARRAATAGFDAIEVHAAHGYLLNQFLSPFSNYRTDEYGGDLEGRLRFPLEVLSAVRAAVGPEFPVGVRISAEEYVPGGHTLAESAVVARRLVESGAHYIHVSSGVPGGHAPPDAQGSDFSATVLLARGVKQVLAVNGLSAPVIAVSRVVRPTTARRIVEGGLADLVAVGRALLADPLWFRKAAAGLDDEIRVCSGCRDCIHHESGCPPLARRTG